MAKEQSIKEVHDQLIEIFAQYKANEIIQDCGVTSKEAKRIILDACRSAMNEIYEKKYGKVE